MLRKRGKSSLAALSSFSQSGSRNDGATPAATGRAPGACVRTHALFRCDWSCGLCVSSAARLVSHAGGCAFRLLRAGPVLRWGGADHTVARCAGRRACTRAGRRVGALPCGDADLPRLCGRRAAAVLPPLKSSRSGMQLRARRRRAAMSGSACTASISAARLGRPRATSCACARRAHGKGAQRDAERAQSPVRPRRRRAECDRGGRGARRNGAARRQCRPVVAR